MLINSSLVASETEFINFHPKCLPRCQAKWSVKSNETWQLTTERLQKIGMTWNESIIINLCTRLDATRVSENSYQNQIVFTGRFGWGWLVGGRALPALAGAVWGRFDMSKQFPRFENGEVGSRRCKYWLASCTRVTTEFDFISDIHSMAAAFQSRILSRCITSCFNRFCKPPWAKHQRT